MRLELLDFKLTAQRLMKLVTKSRRSDHRVEHFEIICIDCLLFKQSLIEEFFNPDFFNEWLYDFFIQFDELFFCLFELARLLG